MAKRDYTVRASHCDHRATDEEIYETLKKTTDPLTHSWDKLERAKTVVLKFNMMHNDPQYFEGRRRELVDDAVCRAVLRLLRERTSARLITTDTHSRARGDFRTPEDFNFRYLLDEFGVEYNDTNTPPYGTYVVPGGGCIFDRYYLNAIFAEADEVVSVAKMKNHGFMGITLSTKNLFGLPPQAPPEGKTRSYYHHLIRLSYMAMITRPCLNIIDGLGGQWGREWGGEGRIADALIAGDHPIATDACGAHLMGHDPASDWPTPPFKRDRNHLLIAARRGFGTVDLEEIDFKSEVTAPLADFDSEDTDPFETVARWRWTTCEQGLFYRDNRERLVEEYAGEFIYLQDGEVVWHGEDPSQLDSRRVLSGEKKDSALWLKLVDPQEWEGERFEAYEECMRLASEIEGGTGA